MPSLQNFNEPNFESAPARHNFREYQNHQNSQSSTAEIVMNEVKKEIKQESEHKHRAREHFKENQESQKQNDYGE